MGIWGTLGFFPIPVASERLGLRERSAPENASMKHIRPLPTSFLALAACVWAIPAGAQDTAVPPAAAPAISSEHTVARGDLRATVALPAVAVAGQAAEIALDPKEWADLVVVSAVPHGSKVRRGDILVVLDTEKLAEQIADLGKARHAAGLALQQGEEALRELEATTPLQLEAAEKAEAQAAADLAYFEKTGRGEAEKAARWSVASAEEALEGAEEELDQLTKMYEADDLTEETEEIVVKRARYTVDSARKRLESVRVAAELALSTEIPRQHEKLRAASRTAEIAAATARATLPRALELKRLETAKAAEDFERAGRKLEHLRADLSHLEVRAPEDGYVYYGSASDGKWESGAAVAKKLVPGGKPAPKEILMTVVSGDVSRLVAVVPEDKLYLLREGSKGRATPVFDPRLSLPAHIAEIAHAPQPGGGFLARLNVDASGDGARRLAPGMNVKVTLEPVNEKSVLTVPLTAVFQEDGRTAAYVKKEAGPEAVAITTGATDGKMVVVTSGLNEGEIVLTSRP